MENSNQTFIVAALFIVAFVFIVISLQPEKPKIPSNQIKICSWNLDNFGLVKSSNIQVVEAIKDRIETCDIFLVSDIEDSSGISFDYLCNRLEDYKCYNSSIQGNLIKQQYGIFWNRFNPYIIDYSTLDLESNFTYPPIYIKLNLNSYVLDIYYFRTDSEKIDYELNELKKLVPNSGNILLMGDFHNDCFYSNFSFDYFNSIVSSNCSYERIYANQNTINYINNSGIDFNFTLDISNNYISSITLNL